MAYEAPPPVKTLTLEKYKLDIFQSEYNGKTFYSMTVYKTFSKQNGTEGKDYRVDQWDGVDEAIILLLKGRAWIKSVTRRPEHKVVKASPEPINPEQLDPLIPEQKSAPTHTSLEEDDIPF